MKLVNLWDKYVFFSLVGINGPWDIHIANLRLGQWVDFAMEAVQEFGPNVIGFQLAMGARRCYIVGCYLTLDDKSTMERVVEALWSRPRGAELLMAGDLNANLAALEGERRAEDIAAKLAMEGLKDMAQHFLPQESRWCQNRRTWGMLRRGRGVQSRTDYILGTDRRLFRNVAVRDPRHKSDHYMVLGCLPSSPLTDQKRYLGRKKRWPVRLPVKPMRTDQLFAALRRAVPKAQPREARQNAWISEKMWRLINKRVSTRRDP